MNKKKTKPDSLDIDLSDLPKEQQRSLEVAEIARERRGRLPSFAGDIFMGIFNLNFIAPFPSQVSEEEEIATAYIEELAIFLKANLDPDKVDETREIPEVVIEGLRQRKAFALKVPKEYGGMDFSQVSYNRVMMMVSSYCASTTVLLSAHQSIGVPQPLKLFGTKEQKEKYFPRFAEGAISAFALTEEEVGSDPAKMETTAILSEDKSHYILNGKKLWCTNGPIADVMVVMANTADPEKDKPEISAFIVEKDYPGISVDHRCDFMGLRGIQNGLLSFDNVKVPAENLLWDEGRGLALALITLNTGRLTVPAACTGTAKLCINIAKKWGKERVQWGKPIAEHENGAHRLSWMAAMTFAMESTTWLTSHMADDGLLDIRIEAAMAKLFCSEAAWEITDHLMQLRGGRGYERAQSLKSRGEEPYPCERMLRDTRINRIIEGTSEIMRLFLAREALDPHLSAVYPLIKRGANILQKGNAFFHLIKKYSSWYPKQLLTFRTSRSYKHFGKLKKHFIYIEKTSHRLAIALFHCMARHGKKIEQQQLLLNHIVEIGTDLFAMAATLSHTHMLQTQSNSSSSLLLCEHFCDIAKERIEGHFQQLKKGKKSKHNELAKKILEGDLSWLEKGII
jgi:alkylation response protein AidB-like acyl-CoA dehydrogenase